LRRSTVSDQVFQSVSNSNFSNGSESFLPIGSARSIPYLRTVSVALR
jgi:hypothetical protein